MSTTTTTTEPQSRNGVDVATLFATLDAVKAERDREVPVPGPQRLAGRHPQPVRSIADFFGAGQEMQHKHVTVVESDHPEVLVGNDHAPTPVEYLLHAIAACLTSGIANIASARGVTLTKVSSTRRGRHRPARHPRAVGRLGPQRLRADQGHLPRRGRRRRRHAARDRRAVAPPLGRLRRADQPVPRPDRGRHRLTAGATGSAGPTRTGRPTGRNRHDARTIDTVVIGAGHAGLAVSHLLGRRGRDHVVLDRGRVAETWRTERWDSLHLLTPRWMTRLPGWRYAGPGGEGFMPRPRAGRPPGGVRRLVGRAARARARGARGRQAATSGGTGSSPTARPGWPGTSSIATGPTAGRTSRLPPRACPRTSRVLTSAQYRNPDQLPDGGVLVVGASASGAADRRRAGPRRASGRPRGRRPHPDAAPLPRHGRALVARPDRSPGPHHRHRRRPRGRTTRAVAPAGRAARPATARGADIDLNSLQDARCRG